MAKWRKAQVIKNQIGSSATGIVTSDMVTKHGHGRRAKLVRMVLLITLIVLALGAVGWYAWNHTHKTSTTHTVAIRALDPLSQVGVDAIKAANTTGVSQGDQIYEKAIASAKTASDKFTLYMGKGALDYNAKEYDAAIAAGLAAEKIHADYRAWGFLATVYDAKGDTKNAIIYYQKAANDNVEFNYDQGIYQQRYKELTNGS